MKMENLPQNKTVVPPEFNVLLHAISSCAVVSIQQLLQQSPELVHTKGWHGQTPLHRACLTGDCATTQLLLESGADPNAINDFQETPVHYASKRGVPTLVYLLQKYGGKLDVKDKSGKLPVHDAAQTGSVYMLQYLEEQGAGFRDVDDSFQSPLHIVCAHGHLEAFKFLMRKGRSDPSQRDKDGNTPLHICAREGYAHGSWHLVNRLLPESLRVANNAGYTPVDLCRQHSSGKQGSENLLSTLEKWAQLPPGSQVKGPVTAFYLGVVFPSLMYSLGIVLSQLVFPNHQGLVFILCILHIIRVVQKATHRLPHVSRWPTPIHAATFGAGILHTIIVYFVYIRPYLVGHNVLVGVSVVGTMLLVYLYAKLLTSDPGIVTASMKNERTNKPMTLYDLCEMSGPMDQFCGECEIVKPKTARHCKLCEKCFLKMDHHCLFLYKCIAYNNHTRFVWFLMYTGFVMAVFVVQVILYVNIRYPDTTYTRTFVDMFWTDCWVLSLSLMNILSFCWIFYLVRYQLNLVSKGQTTVSQKPTVLMPNEQFLNIINFLQGKDTFATNIDVVDQMKGMSLDNRGAYYAQNIHSV